jgi:hypothetical protein
MNLEIDALGRLPKVEGVLNYLSPMPEKPYEYTFARGPGLLRSNAVYEPHSVPIRNMRPIAPVLSLDREGFALVKHTSAVSDFYNEEALRSVYYAEAEGIVAKATGGTRIVVFDHTVRRRVPGGVDRTPGTPRQPSTRVHGDYSTTSGPQRVRDVMGAEADTLLNKRFSIVNVWRPIRGPLRDAPLAVCDAESMVPGDWVASALIYPDRQGENYAVTYRPGHRWFYVPDMRADEAMLLKCYDSAEDGRARFVPHTAFIDPTAVTGILPRESIELRTIVFYQD